MTGSSATTDDWRSAGERSNIVALRAIVWVATHLGRRVARFFLHPTTLYFVLFSPAARRHSQRFLARASGRAASWRDVYRHFHAFASVALDRIWFVKGCMDVFDLQVHGGDVVDAALEGGRGAVLLGAHVGSFEALHAIGESRPGLRVAMAMYPDNARRVHAVLASIAPGFDLGIIAIGRRGSTLQIREWLDRGALVGILGDRHRSDAHGRSDPVRLRFLGHPADFSAGPLRLAMLMRRRVIFMVALYRGGNRYEIRFEPLADFCEPPLDAAARERAVRDALADYVARLESLCRECPHNWFNFYDYWHEDGPH